GGGGADRDAAQLSGYGRCDHRPVSARHCPARLARRRSRGRARVATSACARLTMRAAYRSCLGLHVWIGLVSGWLLAPMFLTGSLAYFQTEISHWMQPALRGAAPAPELALDLALERLREVAPDADRWVVYPPHPRFPTPEIEWWT